jgi:hypothetical protein
VISAPQPRGASTKGDMMRFSVSGARKVALVAIVAVAAPFATITSAEASTTNWGCTVTPLRPVFDHINPANGDKVILYNYTVTCAAGRTIEVNQHIHEEDSVNNYTHQTSNVQDRYFSNDDTVTMGWLLTLRQDDVSGAEEMYHQVSFEVTPDNQSQSGWTPFERSAVQQFSN